MLRFGLRTLLRVPALVVRLLAVLLLPWIGLLLLARGPRWFPSPWVQGAWIAFDGALLAALLALVRRWRFWLGTLLAVAVSADPHAAGEVQPRVEHLQVALQADPVQADLRAHVNLVGLALHIECAQVNMLMTHCGVSWIRWRARCASSEIEEGPSQPRQEARSPSCLNPCSCRLKGRAASFVSTSFIVAGHR